MAFRLKLITVFLFITLSVAAIPAKFYSINARFDISIRNANSVCEDSDGFIWASSKTGILRLTEDSYRIYRVPFETSDVFSVKLAYQESKLLAFTNNGQVFFYNRLNDRFELLINLRKVTNDFELRLNNILLDDADILWFATSSGLFKYQSGQLDLIREITTARYTTIWFDKQHLLIAEPAGIWLFDTESLDFIKIYNNTNVSPFDVSSLYLDKSQDKLWLGTLSNGLFLYDFNSGTCLSKSNSFLTKQPVLAIEDNSDSTLLVGVDGQGIWEINKTTGKVLNVYKENANDPRSLRGNGVYDIYCDKNKRVWICTISGGVSYFDQTTPLTTQIFHHINDPNSLANNEVNSIIEDREGKLWFATNNGISCWSVKSNSWCSYYNNKLEQAQVFLSLCEDDQGKIWAGSYSSGVYVLDEKSGTQLAHYAQNIKDSPKFSDYILDIFKDSRGDLWIGGVNGDFICYLPKENKFRTYSYEPINKFRELAPGKILIGCSYGLSLVDKETGNVSRILENLSVIDLLVDNEIVWLCTSGDGLIKFDYKTGTTEKFTTSSGLPSNFVNSIALADSFLWLGTENGLCRFDPENSKVLTFSSLPLSGISYNAGTYFLMKNGQLAWGTNNGAVFFDPKSFKETFEGGRIFFQDLFISGSSVKETPSFKLKTPVDSLKSLKLKYSQNNLSLDLIPVGTAPGAKFSWKIEGFDQNWSTPSDNRTLTYTNIPSGNYQLKIRLYDSSLNHIISERSLAIKLIPPFWRTAWFYTIIFIVIAGLIVLLMLYYINRLKQIHTEEKVRFFTNTAHEIRTSLTLIKAPVEELNKEKNLSESGRNFLNLAIEQALRLSAVVTQLMDFQKVDIGKESLALSMTDISKLITNRILMFESFAKHNEIELAFDTECDHYKTAVDESKIEKVIDNLISNAIKYSHPGGLVQIKINCDNKKWMLQVKDNGIGINKKAQRKLFKEFYRGDNAKNSKIVGSGIGLLLAKKYVNLHNGIISFESQEDVGSTFKIEIPYRKIAEDVLIDAHTSDMSSSEFAEKDDLRQSQSVNHSNPVLNKMKILIVEDNKDLQNFMQDILSKEFKTYTADDGINAWEFITKEMPDLVVTDVMMPNMNGFELCQLMKSTYETSHIPIILLTALNEKDEQLHGLGLGADDYFTKPFDMHLLVQRIKTIIRNREIVREKLIKLILSDSVEPLMMNSLNDDFLKKAMQIARHNISNPNFNKEIFASEMNISPSLLYKKLKALTNESPTDFIKNIRLVNAMELLKKNDRSVTEVSELCGFINVAYFSTLFKKQFGKSPREV